MTHWRLGTVVVFLACVASATAASRNRAHLKAARSRITEEVGPRTKRAASSKAFAVRPANQPAARFRGLPPTAAHAYARPDWLGGEFQKIGVVIRPDASKASMARAVYNPAVMAIEDGRGGQELLMAVRAEDNAGAGKWFGTSRLLFMRSRGIQKSVVDFLSRGHRAHFGDFQETSLKMEPTEWYEKNGGLEDPRWSTIQVDGRDHVFITYTAYEFDEATNAGTARIALALADKRALATWRPGASNPIRKLGLMFPDGTLKRPASANPNWSKSAAVVQLPSGELLAYYGDDRALHLARAPRPEGPWVTVNDAVFESRPTFFDAGLIEPAFAWLDGNRIHLVYNGDAPPGPHFPGGYSIGEAVTTLDNPAQVESRSKSPFLFVTEPHERKGQVDDVIFLASGMARIRAGGDEVLLAFTGAGDSVITAQVAKARRGVGPR